MRPTWLYAAGAAAGMAIVGSSFAVLDTLRDYPQAGGQAVRYAVGAALLFASAIGGRRLPRLYRAPAAGRLALLAASGLAAFNLLVMAAEESMDPGSVGVIVATVPVLLALAGPLQDGRRPERRVVGAAVVVAAGAAVVQGLGGEVTAAGLAAALGRAGLRGGVLAARRAAARAARGGRRVGLGGAARRADAASRPASCSTGRAGCCACRPPGRRSGWPGWRSA